MVNRRICLDKRILHLINYIIAFSKWNVIMNVYECDETNIFLR